MNSVREKTEPVLADLFNFSLRVKRECLTLFHAADFSSDLKLDVFVGVPVLEALILLDKS